MARGGRRPGAGRKAGSGGRDTEQEKPEFLPKPGRPSEYDPSYCSDIVEFCRQGYSLTAFAGAIGVSRQVIADWGKAHPEFLVATQSAKAASAFWWEQKGRRVAERGGGPGTATMIMFSLKNLSPEDFREKVDHSHEGKVEIGADAAFNDFVRALEGAARAKQGGDLGASAVDRAGSAGSTDP